MTEVDLEGLRRKDAVILVALVLRESEPPRPPSSRWKRVWFVVRWRLRRRLRRLEKRGLIEPGWRVDPFGSPSFMSKVTPQGVITAQAALITLGLEDGIRHFDG